MYNTVHLSEASLADNQLNVVGHFVLIDKQFGCNR